MKTCEHCPYPKRCIPADRCIAFKIGAEPVILRDPKPIEINTTYGVGTTAKDKAPAPKVASKAKKAKKK